MEDIKEVNYWHFAWHTKKIWFLQSFNSLPFSRMSSEWWGSWRRVKKQSQDAKKPEKHDLPPWPLCVWCFRDISNTVWSLGFTEHSLYDVSCNYLQLHISTTSLNFVLKNSVTLGPLALTTALSSLRIWTRCCKVLILLWTARWHQMSNKANP